MYKGLILVVSTKIHVCQQILMALLIIFKCNVAGICKTSHYDQSYSIIPKHQGSINKLMEQHCVSVSPPQKWELGLGLGLGLGLWLGSGSGCHHLRSGS